MHGHGPMTKAEAMSASPQAKEFSCATVKTGGRTFVIVTGRLTVESSPLLRPLLHHAIGSRPPGGVGIDVAATLYVDTSAIATLLEAATLASNLGVPLRLIGVGGEVRSLVEATELDRIFLAMGFEVQLT